MDKFELENGFLDLKINNFLPHIRARYSNDYNLIWKMKGLLDETQNCFVGNDASQTIVFVASSIVNLNELFQSAVLLLEKGLPIPAKILMRTILELSLKIIEALNNDQYIEELIYAFYSEKKSLLKFLDDKQLYHLLSKDKIDKQLQIISQHKNKTGRKSKLTVQELAEKNNLFEAYAIYKIYCAYTHQSLSSIEQVIDFQPQGLHLNGDFRFEDFSFNTKMLLSFTMLPFPALIEKQLLNSSIESNYNLLKQYLESQS